MKENPDFLKEKVDFLTAIYRILEEITLDQYSLFLLVKVFFPKRQNVSEARSFIITHSNNTVHFGRRDHN